MAVSRWRWLLALVVAMTGCAQLPPVGTTAIPPTPPGQARIWVYRELESSARPERPYVRLNGAIVGIADLGGAFYRDVPPGHYHVTVDSMGTDSNQSSDVTLAAGQEAYIKVVQLDNWDESDWEPSFATFYAWLMPPAAGRAEIQPCRFQGGGDLKSAPPQ
jgi:hypothetical protein